MKTPTAFRPPAQGCPRRAGYPGYARFISPQPQRGCVRPHANIRRNPVGVDDLFYRSPRVVALLQPWAELRYPVGVNRA
jgi:hypothetical protein